jgi:hypothetical protein
MNQRPITITILGWLYVAAGTIGLLYHLVDFRTHAFHSEDVWIAFVRLLAIIAGVFMLRGANWARWLALAWIAFHVVIGALHSVQQGIVHALYLVLFAYFLFRQDARSYFRAQAVKSN